MFGAKDTCSKNDYIWAVKNLDSVNPMVRLDRNTSLEADPYILHDYQIMEAMHAMDAAAAAAYATKAVDECIDDGNLKPTFLVPSEPKASTMYEEVMDGQHEDRSVQGGELYSSNTDSDSGSSSSGKCQKKTEAKKPKRKRKRN